MTPTSNATTEFSNYDILRIYAYYRTLLSSLLLLMFYTGITEGILGKANPSLFLKTSLVYTAINIATLLYLWRGHFRPRSEQIFAILLCDIIAMLILMQTSGGIGNGLGYLLLICAAAGGIFLSTQASAALAAVASILTIGVTLSEVLKGNGDSRHVFSAGSLGVLLFFAAFILNYLSNRIRTSNIEAASQAEHAAHVERMAQLIVERMQTGVLVVNELGRIDLMNQAASSLLQLDDTRPGAHYLSDFPEIEDHWQLWKAYPHTRTPHISIGQSQQDIRLGFANLEENSLLADASTLIFIEDNRSLNQEAQQLKLASLGRLTASIAHEIRNPLGAISHASQLLGESPDLAKTDKRMTEIIDTNTKRVNQIIENVLQLSRRRTSQPESVELNDWLQHYVTAYSDEDSEAKIDIISGQDTIKTKMDLSHLNQVLTNLCQNGIRYSREATGASHITLKLGIEEQTELPYLQVIDDGEGISEENKPHVFEPFFTTEASGSGLGLYISKELCQANQANLSYQRTDDGKSCFQIKFAHPKRLL